MKQVITTAFALSLVFILAGCGKQLPTDTDFKGLRLGMPIEEARKVCTEKLKDNPYGIKVGEIKEGDFKKRHGIGVPSGKCFGFNVMGLTGASGGITADASGNVNGISMARGITEIFWKEELKKSKDVLAVALGESLGIGEIPKSPDGSQRLYESKSGLRIAIDPINELIVSVPETSD